MTLLNYSTSFISESELKLLHFKISHTTQGHATECVGAAIPILALGSFLLNELTTTAHSPVTHNAKGAWGVELWQTYSACFTSNKPVGGGGWAAITLLQRN